MKNLIAVLVLLTLIVSQASWGLHTAVLGGVRGGLAVGVQIEDGFSHNIDYRLGIEANTGKNPLILFGSGKVYLTEVSSGIPLSLNLGLVGYAGGASNMGLTLSFIFDNPFYIQPMFIEAGIDVAGSGKLIAQVGYRFVLYNQ